jgi:predicted nucleotidyltransferase
MGAIHAALFGSLARREAGSDSDIDIAVDLTDAAAPGIWEYAGLKRRVGELFAGEVDVIDRGTAKPWLRAEVDRDAIYA